MVAFGIQLDHMAGQALTHVYHSTPPVKALRTALMLRFCTVKLCACCLLEAPLNSPVITNVEAIVPTATILAITPVASHVACESSAQYSNRP